MARLADGVCHLAYMLIQNPRGPVGGNGSTPASGSQFATATHATGISPRSISISAIAQAGILEAGKVSRQRRGKTGRRGEGKRERGDGRREVGSNSFVATFGGAHDQAHFVCRSSLCGVLLDKL